METSAKTEYDRDFYAWTLHSAELLRHRKFSELDIENMAEEIESMGRRDKRELINRLAVLMAHLLKWTFQPGMRCNSWRCTIKEQRIKVRKLLEESPSLKHELSLKVEEAYEEAVVIAASETGLDESTFPTEFPFTFEQCLDSQFLP